MRADDSEFRARVRLDTPREREYLRHGGILPYVAAAPARVLTGRVRRVRSRFVNRRTAVRHSGSAPTVLRPRRSLGEARRISGGQQRGASRGAPRALATVARPGCRAARLRSHPSNLIRVMPAKGGRSDRDDAALGNRAGPGAAARARASSTSFLLWTNLGISLLVLVAASVLRRSRSSRRCSRRIVGGLIGNAMLGVAGADRRRRARADDGAAARAARPARLVPRDRPERAPVPRLVGLRADRDRDRGGARSPTASSASSRLDVEARSSARSRPRSRCSGPSASCAASSARSGSGRSPPRSLYLAWWILDTADVGRLWHAGRAAAARSGSASTS